MKATQYVIRDLIDSKPVHFCILWHSVFYGIDPVSVTVDKTETPRNSYNIDTDLQCQII